MQRTLLISVSNNIKIFCVLNCQSHITSPCHVAEHRPVRSESLQPHTERSNRSGSEPPSVAADVYIWCYALIAVRARKEESHIRIDVYNKAQIDRSVRVGQNT